jgi:hypothetical protein
VDEGNAQKQKIDDGGEKDEDDLDDSRTVRAELDDARDHHRRKNQKVFGAGKTVNNEFGSMKRLWVVIPRKMTKKTTVMTIVTTSRMMKAMRFVEIWPKTISEILKKVNLSAMTGR